MTSMRCCRAIDHWKAALARIQHPSVGKLLDVGLTADGLLYLSPASMWPDGR